MLKTGRVRGQKDPPCPIFGVWATVLGPALWSLGERLSARTLSARALVYGLATCTTACTSYRGISAVHGIEYWCYARVRHLNAYAVSCEHTCDSNRCRDGQQDPPFHDAFSRPFNRFTRSILLPPNLLSSLCRLRKVTPCGQRTLMLYIRCCALLEEQRAVVHEAVLQAAIVYLNRAVAAFVEVCERSLGRKAEPAELRVIVVEAGRSVAAEVQGGAAVRW